jgi:hypothetical protein
MFVLCEPIKVDYGAAAQPVLSPEEFDEIALEALIQRVGVKTVLERVAAIHARLATDGSRVRWQLLCRAYLIGGYDSPNDCDC